MHECTDNESRFEVPRRIELSDGTVIPLPSSEWMSANGVTYLDWVEAPAQWPAGRSR